MRPSNFLAIAFSTILTASGLQAACAQDNTGSAGTSSRTPSQIYLNFHEKMLVASSVDELCPMFAAKRVEQIKSDEEKLPPAQIKAMFQFMQKVSPRKVRILGEAITNDTCTLTLDAPGCKDPIFAAPSLAVDASLASSPESSPETGASTASARGAQTFKKKGTTGKISMVREGGQWKIEKESWMSGD